MSKIEYTPCGGCGATSPDQRCLGCLHNFGAGSWNPSATLSASPSDAERHERAVPDGWQLVPKEPTDAMLKPFGGRSSTNGGSNLASYRVMLAAVPSPPAAVQEPVAVKALEWHTVDDVTQNTTGLCSYKIEHWDGGGFGVYLHGYIGLHKGHLDSLDEAKAAVQADYEQRIRSALTTSPSAPAPEIAALRAEIERLREALTEVLPMAEDMWSNPENVSEIVKARAVLAPQQEEAK